MQKHYAVWLVAAGLLSSLSAGSRVAATEKDGNAPATDPRLGLVTELNATSPHPSLANEAEVVVRLVGTWDVEYTHVAKDGKATHRSHQLVHDAIAPLCGLDFAADVLPELPIELTSSALTAW